MKQVQRHLFFSLLLSAGVIGTDPPHPSSTQAADSKNLQIVPPCQVCRILVNSFQKGFEATARGKHEGGNTGWEESRLGNYADSEIRLVEIQEKLCSDSTRAQTQCQALVEEYESVLEDWWFHKRRENPDLHEFLCINFLKVCCPDNHYGPDCKPCSNGTEKPCSGHGHCKGSGTRKGSGKCKCDEGYKGEHCEMCNVGYYTETMSEGKIECLKCDKSCRGHCREGGPRGCEVCQDGYQHIPDMGCVDINECLELEGDPCKGNSFCANTEGSYTCIECDKACNGCHGDGPDFCLECAKGFIKEKGVCIEKAVQDRTLHAELARYSTYLGLSIATCIIFRRNILVASVIGVLVATYIGLSEYTLGEWNRSSLGKYFNTWLSK